MIILFVKLSLFEKFSHGLFKNSQHILFKTACGLNIIEYDYNTINMKQRTSEPENPIKVNKLQRSKYDYSISLRIHIQLSFIYENTFIKHRCNYIFLLASRRER